MDSSNFSSLGDTKFGGGLLKDGGLCTSEGGDCPFNPLDGQQVKSRLLSAFCCKAVLDCLLFKEFGLSFSTLPVIFWMCNHIHWSLCSTALLCQGRVQPCFWNKADGGGGLSNLALAMSCSL